MMHEKHLAQCLILGKISINPMSLPFSSALRTETLFSSWSQLFCFHPWLPRPDDLFLLILWPGMLQTSFAYDSGSILFLGSVSSPELRCFWMPVPHLSSHVANADGLLPRACVIFSVGLNDSWPE